MIYQRVWDNLRLELEEPNNLRETHPDCVWEEAGADHWQVAEKQPAVRPHTSITQVE